jgi:hypothetical protein
MTTRWRTSAVLLAGVGLALLASPTAPNAAGLVPPTPVVQQLVADVLNVTPTAVRVSGLSERDGAWKGTCTVLNRTVVVDGRPRRGQVSVLADPERWEFRSRLSAKQAAAVCRRVLARRFGAQAPRMRLTSQSKLQGGVLLLGWRMEVAAGVSTGATASFTLEPERGGVIAYAERQPPRQVDLRSVWVSRRVAERQGTAITSAGLPAGSAPSLVSSLLVLSSPLSRNQGPVWLLTFRSIGRGRASQAGPIVALDGMTGAEISQKPRDR